MRVAQGGGADGKERSLKKGAKNGGSPPEPFHPGKRNGFGSGHPTGGGSGVRRRTRKMNQESTTIPLLTGEDRRLAREKIAQGRKKLYAKFRGIVRGGG